MSTTTMNPTAVAEWHVEHRGADHWWAVSDTGSVYAGTLASAESYIDERVKAGTATRRPIRGNDHLDDRDTAILAEKVAALNIRTGPRVGDFIEFADGVTHRFGHDWGRDTGLQTTRGGSFHLGNYGVSYSGGLDPRVSRDDLTDTGRTAYGSVWFPHHNRSVAHNAVHAFVEFRVYATSRPSGWWKRTPAS